MERPNIEAIGGRVEEWELRTEWHHARSFETDKELTRQIVAVDVPALLAYIAHLEHVSETSDAGAAFSWEGLEIRDGQAYVEMRTAPPDPTGMYVYETTSLGTTAQALLLMRRHLWQESAARSAAEARVAELEDAASKRDADKETPYERDRREHPELFERQRG